MTECFFGITSKTRFSILLSVAAALLVFAPHSASARSYSYFDMDETYSSNSGAFTKWNSMLARFEKQRRTPEDKCGQVDYYPCEKVKNWMQFLSEQKDKSFDEKVEAVNSYMNAFPYVTDQANWGGKDFWETPYEFFTVSGNCKDYAIAKYFSLRALGVPAKSMRIIVLEDLNLGGVIHAVLGVYHNGKLVLLDNQIKQVVSASDVYHYRPIYGINEAGWWRYQPRNPRYEAPVIMEAKNATKDAVASGSPQE